MAGLSTRKQLAVGIVLVLFATLYYYHKEGRINIGIFKSIENFFINLLKPKATSTPRKTPPSTGSSSTASPSSSTSGGRKEPDVKARDLDTTGPDLRTPAPWPQDRRGVRLIAKEELKRHGPNGPFSPVWLSIIGQVYNVEKGKEHYYGPNGGYKFFSGIDGTRAYVTGEFNKEGLVENIYDLTARDCKDLLSWTVDTYDKDYIFVGKLIGGFYDKEGNPTEMRRELDRQAEKAKDTERLLQEEQQQFPSCNSRWNPNEGGWVYCGKRSGGIHRDWEGLPRRYFSPITREERCACVHDRDLDHPKVNLYANCAPDARECQTRQPGSLN
jgi:hypothetical protein